MLDLKLDREAIPPKDAATILLVRDTAAGKFELFCVERSKQSRFLGGAIVFPGGKLDEGDGSEEWTTLVTAPRAPRVASEPYARDDAHLRALAVAAERETLEEAALLHVHGAPAPLADAELLALRQRLLGDPAALRAFLRERGLRLDLEALHPLSRWVTPVGEARRYDTRFFVAIAPPGQSGAHDEHETMSSFWSTADTILERWEKGEVALSPPTHRTLWSIAALSRAEDVIALARESNLDPICPRLIPTKLATGEDTLALTLPGDPEHELRTPIIGGPSRYVRHGARWVPENTRG